MKQKSLILSLLFSLLALAHIGSLSANDADLAAAVDALHEANIIKKKPSLVELNQNQKTDAVKKAIDASDARGKAAMLNATTEYNAIRKAVAPLDIKAFKAASDAFLAKTEKTRGIITTNTESFFDPYDSMADAINRRVLFVDAEVDDDEGSLDTAFQLHNLLKDTRVIDQLIAHNVHFADLFKELMQREQKVQDATTIADDMKKLDRIAGIEEEAATFINELVKQFKEHFIFEKDLDLPPAPPEIGTRKAFHAAARKSFKDRLYGEDYQQLEHLIDSASERLKIYVPQQDFDPQVAEDERTRKQKVKADVIRQLKPFFKRGQKAENARKQAQASGQDPATVYNKDVQALREIENKKEEMKSGRIREYLQAEIREIKAKHNEKEVSKKRRQEPLTPHTIFTPPLPQGERLRPLQSLGYYHFSIPSHEKINGQQAYQIIPGYSELGKQSFDVTSPKDIETWQMLYQAVSDGQIATDDQGQTNITHDDLHKKSVPQLYLKQTSSTDPTHSWYEPLRPYEQHLLTHGLFAEVHSSQSTTQARRKDDPIKLARIKSPEHLQEMRAIRASILNLYPKSLKAVQGAIEYALPSQPNKRFRKRPDGKLVRAETAPYLSFGVYPGFAKKLGILGLDIGVHSMLQRSFYATHLNVVTEKILRNPKQIALLLKKESTPLKSFPSLKSFFRSMPGNPFKSPHLMQLLGYVAIAEGMHWAKKVSNYDFLTMVKHRFDDFMIPAINEVMKHRSIDAMDNYIYKHTQVNPTEVGSFYHLPVSTLFDWGLSGRVTPLSPINSIFSFFVDDTVDLDSVRNLRGFVNAASGGNALDTAKQLRPSFYSSPVFQFMRRLLISFFTLRYLDGNYAGTLAKKLITHKKKILYLLHDYQSGTPSQRQAAQEELTKFVHENSALSGGSILGKLLGRIPGLASINNFTKDAQVLFASKVKASLVVNSLLAIPVITKMLYLHLKPSSTAY